TTAMCDLYHGSGPARPAKSYDGTMPGRFLLLAAALVGCQAREATRHRDDAEAPRPPPAARGDGRGADFPDGVVALTWDDGPDAGTLALARWLHADHVSGTFFVVGEWIDGVSDEPGVGPRVHESGYAVLPILETLVRLGHRLGSHTRNHA